VTRRERLFFAVELPSETRNRLRAALEGFAATAPLPGRAVPAANWHLTIRFLGDLEPGGGEAARRTVRATDLGPAFAACIGGLGAFPRPERARVVWAGITRGTTRLAELAARTEAAVRAAGLLPERRPYRPHLTLARLRTPTDVRPWVRHPLPSIELPVREMILLRSVQGPEGVRYDALDRYALWAGEDAALATIAAPRREDP
jgi:RNA 2',3'-cyclic 3'-phosphodiesterase